MEEKIELTKDIVVRIFEMYYNGKSYQTISNILNEEKVLKLIDERNKNGLFKNYEDFVLRTKDIIAYSLLENIIYSGALDIFGISKKAMIDSYKTIIEKEQYSFVKSLDIEYNEEEFTYGELLIKEKEAKNNLI